MKFEKVSYNQFRTDYLKCLGETEENVIQAAYELVTIPCRATSGSAGYDIVSPVGFTLSETATIPTGLRVKLDQDKVLLCLPRSGLGFKTGMRLANTVGVIDADYYYADNEGHIMIKLVKGFKDLEVKAGDRIAQSLILPYFTTEDDTTTAARTGGFGSTGK